MTALRVPARPDADGEASPRPIPWRRMAGVAWRQHRAALAGVAVLLGALAVWLWRMGVPLHQEYAAAVSCHPAGSGGPAWTSPSASTPDAHFMGTKGPGGVLLQVLPALIGAFIGAPVLARELEVAPSGSPGPRASSAGAGRWPSWCCSRIILAIVTAAFGALVAWYFQPYGGADPQVLGLFENSPFGDLFSLREVTFPAWTVAAFAIAALAGMLIRRVVPAIVATLAVYAGLAFATAGLLREHYLTPLVTTAVSLPGASTEWVLGQWSTLRRPVRLRGRPAAEPRQSVLRVQPGEAGRAARGGVHPVPGAARLRAVDGYQRARRLWPFQWIEGG